MAIFPESSIDTAIQEIIRIVDDDQNLLGD